MPDRTKLWEEAKTIMVAEVDELGNPVLNPPKEGVFSLDDVPLPPDAMRAKTPVEDDGRPLFVPHDSGYTAILLEKRRAGRPKKALPPEAAVLPPEAAIPPKPIETTTPEAIVPPMPQDSVKEKKAMPEKRAFSVMESYPYENEDVALARSIRERRERGVTTSERHTGDPLFENSLSQDFEQESNIKTVSKELFSKQGINVKTEISHNEINDITKLGFLKERFKIGNTEYLVQSLLEHRVSLQRKSRDEFIRALQTENKNANPAGTFLNRFFGGQPGGTP